MTRPRFLTSVAMTLLLMSTGAVLMARGHNVKKPAASAFGMGPRTSAQGMYVATIVTTATLQPRRMYTLEVSIADAEGKPIDDATIEVDGGMPQHGHGFPTLPRITRNLGSGSYELSGLRFNMGGWWELKLAISTPCGTDTVTFNLAL